MSALIFLVLQMFNRKYLDGNLKKKKKINFMNFLNILNN